MRKINKLLILVGISIILLSSSIIFVAGYFSSIKSSNDITNDNSSFEPEYIEISTYNDLVNNSLYNEELSNSNQISNPIFLKFTSDIALYSNLVIYSDVNINLNGFKLNLNGKNLTFKNSYYTCLVIENGIITNNSTDVSNLYFDLPNGVVSYNGTIDENEKDKINIEILEKDSDKVLDNALNYALFKLYGYNYGLNLYNNSLYSCRGCRFSHEEEGSTTCIYAKGNLEFIDHLYGYNVNYNYKSSDEKIINNYGRRLKDGTIKLSITASILDKSKMITVYVHSLANNNDDYNKAALGLLYQQIEMYFDEDINKYNFSSQILVPKKNNFLNVSYDYKFYKNEEEVSGILALSNDDGYNIMTLNSNITSFEIIASINDVSLSSGKISVLGNAVSNIVDKNTIARQLVSKLIGSQLNVTKDNTGINGYTKNDLSTDISQYSSYVGGISYSLVNNSDNIYNIENNVLQVNPSGVRQLNPEESLTSTAVICTVEFIKGTGLKPESIDEVKVSIPIRYLNNDGQEAGLSSFRPYYVQFDKWISGASGGQTLDSFVIRGTIGNNYPIINLTPELYTKDNIKIIGIIKNGGTYPVFVKNNDGIEQKYYIIDNVDMLIEDESKIIDINDLIQFSYLNGENVIDKDSITEEIVKSGNLNYKINIVLENILEEITTVSLKYEYKMTSTSDWNADGGFVSYFNIPGIYRCGENERFTDQTLFDYIKGLGVYGSQQTAYFNTRLMINGASFDVENKEISSFKGLEAFKNVTALNASKSKFKVSDIDYISKMDSLEKLNISNNNLSDYSSDTMGFPSGTKNDFISTLGSLKYLNYLDVSKNKIYDFSGLKNLSSIKTIHLENNLFSHEIGFLGWKYDVGGIINSIYGSKGVLNTTIYSQLISRDVTIYYDVNGTESVKFVSEGNVDAIYKNLTNIEYQKNIAEGTDITKIFENYCEYKNNRYEADIKLFNGGKVQSSKVDVKWSDSKRNEIDGHLKAIEKGNTQHEYVEFKYEANADPKKVSSFIVSYHYTIFAPNSTIILGNYNDYQAVSVDISIPYEVKRY